MSSWYGSWGKWINEDTGELMSLDTMRCKRLEEDIDKLEADNAKLRQWNVALRKNTSKSVLRRLGVQLGEEE